MKCFMKTMKTLPQFFLVDNYKHDSFNVVRCPTDEKAYDNCHWKWKKYYSKIFLNHIFILSDSNAKINIYFFILWIRTTVFRFLFSAVPIVAERLYVSLSLIAFAILKLNLRFYQNQKSKIHLSFTFMNVLHIYKMHLPRIYKRKCDDRKKVENKECSPCDC